MDCRDSELKRIKIFVLRLWTLSAFGVVMGVLSQGQDFTAFLFVFTLLVLHAWESWLIVCQTHVCTDYVGWRKKKTSLQVICGVCIDPWLRKGFVFIVRLAVVLSENWLDGARGIRGILWILPTLLWYFVIYECKFKTRWLHFCRTKRYLCLLRLIQTSAVISL